MKVLIVEDDTATAEMIKESLSSCSHTSDIAANGADGSFMAKSYEYDAIVLDYSLPKKDGLAVCREIRGAQKTTPIIFLSSTGDTEMKITALEHGADDYMTKPFSFAELEARLRAIARRPKDISSPILSLHDLTIDIDKHIVMRGNTRIQLTRKELGVLEYLMRHKGTIVSRSSLMEHVWTADNDPFSNTVEAHIRNLKKKLNIDNKPNLITNVIGRGYIIDTPERILAL